MRASAVKFTYRDYVQFPEDNNRHEIIDGDHYMTPSPSTRHQRISQRLYDHLKPHVTMHRLGELFYAPTDVVLSDTDVLVPDLLFIRQERGSVITEKNIQGAPDLVVEILSPSTAERDRGLKRTTYARFGVEEYWLVSPDTSTVEVWRLQEGIPSHTFTRSERLISKLLPGFELPLTDVFRP